MTLWGQKVTADPDSACPCSGSVATWRSTSRVHSWGPTSETHVCGTRGFGGSSEGWQLMLTTLRCGRGKVGEMYVVGMSRVQVADPVSSDLKLNPCGWCQGARRTPTQVAAGICGVVSCPSTGGNSRGREMQRWDVHLGCQKSENPRRAVVHWQPA